MRTLSTQLVRSVATGTHVRTWVPEKMSKVKKNETKQNNRNIKQTEISDGQKKHNRSINFPYFFEILIFQNKR